MKKIRLKKEGLSGYYDSDSHVLVNEEGEILRDNVVLKFQRSIQAFKDMTDTDIDKLSKQQVAGMVRHKYKFQGVRIAQMYPIYGNLLKFIDQVGEEISQAYKFKILNLYLRLSSKGGILYSPRKHAIIWMDLMKVDYLNLNSQAEVYRFKRALVKFNFVKQGENRLVVNPHYGYSNTILFADTYFAFKDILEVDYLVKRYFELGFDSIIKQYERT
ncbi:MAG: hypothetical protein DRI95_15015 [Bacteroidetes bacterium]|nr:MAG: hypothetical protein DRI95_15015 [Bacteroidota bacterium]